MPFLKWETFHLSLQNQIDGFLNSLSYLCTLQSIFTSLITSELCVVCGTDALSLGREERPEDLTTDVTTPTVIGLASGRQGIELGLLSPCSVFLPLVPILYPPPLHLGHLQYLQLMLLSGA